MILRFTEELYHQRIKVRSFKYFKSGPPHRLYISNVMPYKVSNRAFFGPVISSDHNKLFDKSSFISESQNGYSKFYFRWLENNEFKFYFRWLENSLTNARQLKPDLNLKIDQKENAPNSINNSQT